MRFITLAVIISLLSPSFILAGGFEPGFDDIHYGYEPEVYVNHGQQGQWYGQHDQWQGQHGQWQDYGQVWRYERPVIHRRQESQVFANVCYAPSSMTTFGTQWALQGYGEYDQWHRQSRRHGRRDGYWGYWNDQARYDHEMEMTKLQYQYRDREMNRIRNERRRQERHNNRIAGFTMLGMSIPFLIGGFN